MKNATGQVMVLALGIWLAAVFSIANVLAESQGALPEHLLYKPVDELIRLALENNPGIKVAEAQVQLAQAELVRQRTEVAMKVSEVAARWRRTEAAIQDAAAANPPTVKESVAANLARDEADQELRSLTGAGLEKGPTAPTAPPETHKASLEIRIGRYGELTWEVKGLPIPEDLCRGSGHIGRLLDIIQGMWWLKGPEVKATIVAPIDVSPNFISGVVQALKMAKIESFSCVPTTEHMALPTIEDNLRTIGEALQHAFKEKVTGKIGTPDLEAFLKEFQIPTANLKPTDREMTYRLEMFAYKTSPNDPRIGAFAALPGGGETCNSQVIFIENGVPKGGSQGYGEMIGNPINLWAQAEKIFSKSVKVPASNDPPASNSGRLQETP